MMDERGRMFRELEDRWILYLRREHVDSVSSGTELVIRLESGTEIVVNGNALVSKGSIRAPEANTIRVADMTDEELQGFVGSTIASAVAFKSGSLRIAFSTGQDLNVRASEREASARVRRPECYDWSFHDQSVEMVIHAEERP